MASFGFTEARLLPQQLPCYKRIKHSTPMRPPGYNISHRIDHEVIQHDMQAVKGSDATSRILVENLLFLFTLLPVLVE
jgi:hypothetical protein